MSIKIGTPVKYWLKDHSESKYSIGFYVGEHEKGFLVTTMPRWGLETNTSIIVTKVIPITILPAKLVVKSAVELVIMFEDPDSGYELDEDGWSVEKESHTVTFLFEMFQYTGREPNEEMYSWEQEWLEYI